MSVKFRHYGRVLFLVVLLLSIIIMTGLTVIRSTAQTEESAIELLEQARGYQKQGLYNEAEENYKDIIEEYPSSELMEEARKNLIIIYVGGDRLAEAKAVFQNLPTEFSGKGELLEAIQTKAYNRIKKKNSLQKAKEIYQFIVNELGGDEYAMWLQTCEVINYIWANEQTAAQNGIDSLRDNYWAHKDIAKAVNKIGDHYYMVKEYQKAGDIFRLVVDCWGQSEYGIRAQLSLIDMAMQLKDETAIEAAINKLQSEFAEHPEINWARIKAGDNYYKRKNYQQALQLYQMAAVAQGQIDLWLQKRLIITYYQLGENSTAEATINKLLTDFANDPEMGEMANRLARQCRKLEKYEKAQALYQYVLDNHPNSDCIVEARVGLLLAGWMSEGSEDVRGTIEKIIADYEGYKNLPEVLLDLCSHFCERANRAEGKGSEEQVRQDYQKAVEVGEKILEKLPDSSVTISSYQLAGDCYRRLGQYDKAIECYQKLLLKEPEAEYNWHVQFLIGQLYQQMRNNRLISKSEANERTQSAYEKVLDDYPSCPAAAAARDWLDHNKAI